MEIQKTLNSQKKKRRMRKENETGEIKFLDFSLYYIQPTLY